MHDPMVYGPWGHSAYWYGGGSDEVYMGMYESIEFLDDGIRATIRDDAKWSDGRDIRAKDAAGNAALWRSVGRDDGYEVEKDTANPWHAFDELRFPDGIDGKIVKFHDPRGVKNKFAKGRMLRDAITHRWAVWGPSHVEPYKSLYDAALENLQSGIEGGDWTTKDPLVKKHMVNQKQSDQEIDLTYIEMWRNPDEVVTSGAWTLSEIRGAQEIVLEPNPHYRNADEVNYDTVIQAYAEGDERRRAMVQADRTDYFGDNLPPGAGDSLDDNIELFKQPGGKGTTLGFNHDDPHVGKRDVRAAILYALDKENIAQNVHPTAKNPVTVPGGDMWAREAILSDEWTDDNLIDYSHDPGKATQLLENAGYSKEDSAWVGPDGNEMEFVFPTTADAPRLEVTVAEQLSEFGIPTQVQSFDDATFEEKRTNGDFSIWPSSSWNGMYSTVSVAWWWTLNHAPEMETWSYFDNEKEKEAIEGYSDNGWVSGNYKLWEDLTIEVPPIGQSDGDLEEINPAYLHGRRFRGPGEVDRDHWEQFMWIANWFLPGAPLTLTYNQVWLDTAHWNWPKDSPMWEYFKVTWNETNMLSLGQITANPDDTEEGATVEE